MTVIVICVGVEKDTAMEVHITNLVEEGRGNKGRKGVLQLYRLHTSDNLVIKIFVIRL